MRARRCDAADVADEEALEAATSIAAAARLEKKLADSTAAMLHEEVRLAIRAHYTCMHTCSRARMHPCSCAAHA